MKLKSGQLIALRQYSTEFKQAFQLWKENTFIYTESHVGEQTIVISIVISLSKRDLLIDAWWDVIDIKNMFLQSRTLNAVFERSGNIKKFFTSLAEVYRGLLSDLENYISISFSCSACIFTSCFVSKHPFESLGKYFLVKFTQGNDSECCFTVCAGCQGAIYQHTKTLWNKIAGLEKA